MPPKEVHSASKKHATFEYLTLPRPTHDFEKEANEAEDSPDEDESDEFYQAQFEGDFLQEPIAKHPEHKWFAFWQTWKLLCDWQQAADFCDPDSFGMYVYDDFAGWGLQECIERMKERDEDTVKHMWAVTAAMAHWLMVVQLGPWMGCDDAERISETWGAIGTMFLTALNELDRAGLLKADSPIKDLPLVMAIYLKWSADLDEMEDELSWRPNVIAYAKKAGIDLATSGLFGAGELVSALEEEEESGEIAPLSGQAKADRWGWKKTLASLKKRSAKFVGRELDITKWTRAERARHAFNKKDPLADIPEKERKAGNIRLA
ncbi:hypothetical protein PG994_012462 [Apiospora phragmitis]|uniref:Uncharacterized protein n=1 Tax=Apiospora phragmitis TaxID=2905665 RepID=A0ABR1TVW6_9PEZI